MFNINMEVKEMTKLDRLIREAKEGCTWRGHRMARFEHNGNTASSDCIICKMGVTVRVKPMPNQIDIGGEAIALNCH